MITDNYPNISDKVRRYNLANQNLKALEVFAKECVPNSQNDAERLRDIADQLSIEGYPELVKALAETDAWYIPEGPVKHRTRQEGPHWTVDMIGSHNGSDYITPAKERLKTILQEEVAKAKIEQEMARKDLLV